MYSNCEQLSGWRYVVVIVSLLAGAWLAVIGLATVIAYLYEKVF